MLAEAGLEDRVEMRLEDGAIVITPSRNPREGWAESIDPVEAANDPFFWDEYVEDDDFSWWTWPEGMDDTGENSPPSGSDKT